MLPKKRTRQRTKPVERRIWPRHRRFVTSHECSVANMDCLGPVVFAHLRLGTHTGMEQKPHDRFGIALCHYHHSVAHDIGEATFQARHQFDWAALAAEFTAKSTDTKMKESLKSHQSSRLYIGGKSA